VVSVASGCVGSNSSGRVRPGDGASRRLVGPVRAAARRPARG
jgi:hypothetical protein